MPGHLILLKDLKSLMLSSYTPAELNLNIAALGVEFLFNYIKRLQAANMLIWRVSDMLLGISLRSALTRPTVCHVICEIPLNEILSSLCRGWCWRRWNWRRCCWWWRRRGCYHDDQVWEDIWGVWGLWAKDPRSFPDESSWCELARALLGLQRVRGSSQPLLLLPQLKTLL